MANDQNLFFFVVRRADFGFKYRSLRLIRPRASPQGVQETTNNFTRSCTVYPKSVPLKRENTHESGKYEKK